MALRQAGISLVAATALVALGACRHESSEATTALAGRLARVPPIVVKPAVWRDVQTFYSQRGGRPAWLDGLAPSRQANAGLELVRSASAHGLDPADYGDADLSSRRSALTAKGAAAVTQSAAIDAAAEFDLRLTTALLTLGHDVAVGRSNPANFEPDWKIRRTLPDLPGTLISSLDTGVSGWLDAVQPKQPQYSALRKQLATLIASRASNGGVDAPADPRIDQLAANLERWRWMPDDFGPRYLLVNVPSLHVSAVEDGHTVLDSRVIVGREDRRTPVFSATMTTVVFSPYWNIPDTIAQGETIPAMAKDPKYLAKNEIEVVRRSKDGSVVVLDPSKVHWSDPDELKGIAFRQRPGPKNALGHVSFLFPNPYDVYLHDTPADELFAQAGRALSHGCVRVEQPRDLAQYVLRGDPDWDAAKIDEAMSAGVERQVTLKEHIPVHLVYFTAWIDEPGGLTLFKDIYGYDRPAVPRSAAR